jgi:hypothetical protein
MMRNKTMLTFDDLTAIYPEHLWIELSVLEQQTAWHQAVMYDYTYSAARHRAFVNYLCLNYFVKWLQDEPDLQNKFDIHSLSPDLHQRWEVVNGIDLNFNETRLVLIPSEQGSICEFRIPQEWVDIPSWAANYYLAVQVNLEANWLRIWGFVSYEQVREKANYDFIDRTYCLKNTDLIPDINIMFVAQELCALKQPQVKPLPSLSEVQAKGIIEQLSKQTVYSPRLDVSFPVWGAILESDEYRQILYTRRRQNLQYNLMTNPQKIVHNLSLWFENVFTQGWQSVDDFLSLTDTRAFQFRSDSVLNEICVKGAKLIDLGMQLENKSLVLLIGLSPPIDNKVGIRVQLYPAFREGYLPASLTLSLLSESGITLQSVESRSYDNYIQLKRFKLPLGKFFSIQVALKHVKIIENFVLEGFPCSEI